MTFLLPWPPGFCYVLGVRVQQERQVRRAQLLRDDRAEPKLDQNQFGGSIGGPVKRSKTFFFADCERFRLTQGVTFVSTVPTAKMRAGDFSEVSTPIYDPSTATRTVFQGNVIPSNRLDAIALKYMALYPLPNGSGLANNFTGTKCRTTGARRRGSR